MYAFPIYELPTIKKEYSIIRHSVWQAIDPNHIIIFIKEGRCIFEIENHTFNVEPGDCVFIPKNTIYTRHPFEKEICTMIGIHFSMNGFQVSADDIKDEYHKIESDAISINIMLNSVSPKFNNFYIHTVTHLQNKKQLVEQLLDTIFAVKPQLNYYPSVPFSAFLTQLLALISEEAVSLVINRESLNDTSYFPKSLRKAIFYIQQNYYKQISLEDLCDFCYISKIQLNRLFNTYLDITPINYIINYKINKAKDLLQNCSNMSIKEIGMLVGYEDQCYFSRIFAKLVGCSPSEFRTRTLSFDEKKHIQQNLE